MSLTREVKASDVAKVGLVQGAVGTGFAAAAGALGATVLQQAAYAGLSVVEGATTGAIGGAILGVTNGALEAVGFFGRSLPRTTTFRDRLSAPFRDVGFGALAGLLGYAIQNSCESMEMDALRTTAALAIGAAILYVPKLFVEETLIRNSAPAVIPTAGVGLLGDTTLNRMAP